MEKRILFLLSNAKKVSRKIKDKANAIRLTTIGWQI
jgi:hypothetical protein